MQFLKSRILSWLLMAANTRPPCLFRDRFYAHKKSLLNKYAKFTGIDIQHIKKHCWTCNGTGNYSPSSICRNCSGTGVYAEFWIHLEKYCWNDYIFYVPMNKSYFPPLESEGTVIEGRIIHELHWAWHEAWLWLALIDCTSWVEYWSIFKSGSVATYYPLPLSKLQQVVFWTRGNSLNPKLINYNIRGALNNLKQRICGRKESISEPDFDDIPF